MAIGSRHATEWRDRFGRCWLQPGDPAPRPFIRMKRIEQVVLAADLAGTAVFAIEGANAAIGAGLDLFGVMVLSLVVALGGGVIRDLLIGARPPSAVSDWRYPALAFAAGLFAFVFHARVASFPPSLLTALDAAGLALFAVAGAVKALEFRVHPFIATLMGAVTGCGGAAWCAICCSHGYRSCWSPTSTRARRCSVRSSSCRAGDSVARPSSRPCWAASRALRCEWRRCASAGSCRKLPRGRKRPTHDPFVAAGTSNTRSNAHWNTNA